LPISIAPEEYTNLLNSEKTTAEQYAEWVARYSGRKVLLAVDRLDYTKGVLERLRAYAHLLRSSPELREKVIVIQIAVPTREGMDAYQDLRTERSEERRVGKECRSRWWMHDVEKKRSI